MPFHSKRIDYFWLAAALLAASGVCANVHAASVETRVERAARAHLLDRAERSGLVNPSVELRLLPRSREGTPGACAQDIKVNALDTRHVTRMVFAAECNATPAWRAEFVVRGTVFAEVVVAATNLAAGQVIAAEDLVLERRDVTAMPDATSDIAQVAGHTSRRAVRKGQAIGTQWLIEPVLVTRGTPVNILARNAGVEVHVAGEAMETGRRNEVIRVRNTATGKVIRARVIAEGTVEPEDIPGASAPR